VGQTSIVEENSSKARGLSTVLTLKSFSCFLPSFERFGKQRLFLFVCVFWSIIKWRSLTL
jgi:hypothetical protein